MGLGLGATPLSRLMVPRIFLRAVSPSFAGLAHFSQQVSTPLEASLPPNVLLDTATQAYLKKEALLEQCELQLEAPQ